MDRDDGLLSRDIAAVDMRLADRLVVQLTPEAAVRRKAALERAARKPGQAKPGKKHMSWLGAQKDGPARRSGVVTVLDVGSSKVCCIDRQAEAGAAKASCCAAAPTRRR